MRDADKNFFSGGERHTNGRRRMRNIFMITEREGKTENFFVRTLEKTSDFYVKCLGLVKLFSGVELFEGRGAILKIRFEMKTMLKAQTLRFDC